MIFTRNERINNNSIAALFNKNLINFITRYSNSRPSILY